MDSLQKHPEIPEPAPAEIQQANDALEQAYDFRLPDEEAAKFVRLVKELQQWERTSRGDGPDSGLREFTAELSRLFVTLRGVEADGAELSQDAEALLKVLSFQEMKRVTGELAAIVVENRPVPLDPAVTGKMAEFLKREHGLDLEEENLGQVIQYAWRVLWIEEGFGSSLGSCLDDWNGGKDSSHPEVRHAVDHAAGKLAGKA